MPERKNAASQPREQMLVNILESVQDGVAAYDENLTCIYANKQGCQWLGRDMVDLIEKNIVEIVAEKSRNEALEACERALASQQPQSFESCNSSGDCWVENNVIPNPMGISIIFRDITQRKQQEAAAQGILRRRTDSWLADSSVLENLREELLRVMADKEALLQINSSLIEIEKLDDAMQMAADILAKSLRYGRVVIITFNLAEHQVTGYYRGGQSADAVFMVPFEELWEGLSGWVLRERKAALSPYGVVDERESPMARKRRAETNCGALAVIPIAIQGDLLGTLTVINKPEERQITQSDVDLLVLLSNQVAQAIENNRLYKSLTREIAVRKQAQVDLLQAHDVLEQRVQARTNELRVVNRAMRTLTECNQALVRSKSEDELMREICRILVTTGGYHLAWIGFIQHDASKSVRPMAWAGFEDGYLDTIRVSWADNEFGQGPTGTSTRTRKIAIARDILNDPAYMPWRAQALLRGYRSAAGIPLLDGDSVMGVINLYSTQIDIFNSDEQTLLSELANDMVYGINSLRTRIERLHYEERFSNAFQSNPVAISITRLSDGIVVDVNPSYLNLFGNVREQVVGKFSRLSQSFVDQDQMESLRKKVLNEKSVRNVETQIHVQNGEIKEVIFAFDLIDIENSPLVLSTIVDITERKKMEQALRQSQANYQLVSENTGDVIWLLDIETMRFTYVSPSVQKMRGFSAQETMEQSLAEVLTPESKTLVDMLMAERLSAFYQNHLPATFIDEVDQYRRDGTIVHTEITTDIVLDEAGRIQVVGVSRDITERKRANELLKKSQASLEAAQAIAHMGNWERDWDARGGIWSKEMFNLFNLETAHGVPTPSEFFDMVHPEDLVRLSEANARATQTTGPVIVEYRTHPSRGELRFFEARIQAMKEEDGSYYNTGTLLDITERKKMELAVRERVKELTCLFKVGQLLETDILLDAGTVCQQIVDLMVPAMQFPLAAAAVIDLDGQLYQTGGDPSEITRGLESNIMVASQLRGRLAVYYTTDLPYILPEEQNLVENVARMLEIWIERKESSVALRKSDDRFRQLAGNIQEVFWIFDIENDVLVYISPAYEMIWGRTIESLYRNPSEFLESILFEDRAVYLKAINAQLSGEAVDMEYRIRRTNGTIRWIWDRRTPVYNVEGRVVRSTGVCTDITVLKTTQQDIEDLNRTLELRVQERTAELRLSRDDLAMANVELAKASRLKDEFLSSMSHELRTPLTGILGLSETMQMGTYGNLTPRQEKALKNIENSGRHLLELINDILDLSKIEAGKLDMQFSLCSLMEICQASLHLTKGLAQQKRLNVAFTMNNTQLVLRADGRRLKQMLVNLLSNAIKFTPEGGTLGLEVCENDEEQTLRLSVWDHGIGIKEEEMGKLFKPFVQIDSSLSRQYSGTGLGLSLVQRMADLHGGSVEVSSTYGQGSRFTIVLPWSPDLSSQAISSSLDGQARPLDALDKLMTIEDNELDAEQITTYLKSLGLDNTIHPVARGAVEVAVARRPKMILLDLHLPDGSGLDVLAKLQADERTQAIPVIVIALDERRSEAAELGAVGYLLKPFTLEELRKELERAAGLTQPTAPVLVSAPKSAIPVVMIADDNEIILETLTEYLRAQHFHVVAAHSGFELLERVTEFYPDILLVDIQMPGMDGMETIRRLRAHPEGVIATVPIIAVTALAMAGDRDKILSIGANEYMSKPISLLQLSQTIARFLAQNKNAAK
jgi:PAS domain S-box-containing protein